MKNLLLSTLLLLTSSVAFAQLYVTPNVSTSTDSYIYVDNQVLFVEQDVNLVKNSSGTTEASIYLRNQSQLLQGTTSSLNDGTGLISVIQDSRSDSYDYNYWSSPVGNPTFGGGTAGNKNFGIGSVYDSLSVTNSSLAGHTGSVNGSGSGMGSSTPLVISRRWMYKRPAGSGWTAIGTSNAVDPGLGFTMKGTNTTTAGDGTTVWMDANNQRYDFRGRPNNGNINVTTANDGSILSGNPYPSALDLNRLFWDADNTEIVEFRYWDEDRSVNSHLYSQNKGGYGSWVPGASDPNGMNPGTYTAPTFVSYNSAGDPMPADPSDDSGANYERRFAPVGQGYIIKAGPTLGGDVTNNQITIKNSHRRFIQEGVGNNSQFRGQEGLSSENLGDGEKPETVQNRNPGNEGMARIYTEFGESHYRDMVMLISDNATYYFDRGFDARHPMDGGGNDAYWPAYYTPTNPDMEEWVIQGVPMDRMMRLPFAIKVDDRRRDVYVSAVEEENIRSGGLYLYDSWLDFYQPISHGNKAQISFLEAGVYDDRFFITYYNEYPDRQQEEAEAKSEEAQVSVDFFQNNRAGLLEVSNPEGYEIVSANVFDMAGRLVYSQTDLGDSTKFVLPTSNLSDGVYIVKLTTDDNVTIDYKMTVTNK